MRLNAIWYPRLDPRTTITNKNDNSGKTEEKHKFILYKI